MGQDGTPNQPTIPAYMVALASQAALMADNGAGDHDRSGVSAYFTSPNDDIMAGFSSQGPTDVDFRVKPDVVAPGVNVLSSIPHVLRGARASRSSRARRWPRRTSRARRPSCVGQHPDWRCGRSLRDRQHRRPGRAANSAARPS